ncbi:MULTISPECIES: thiamine pyrophosphate-dependent enzyme [unclassified Bradyrhizobium]|uniref:thiamine pyrophosphate-dependent enzyme n=1 Tax=unclassified Bradyrhizobium TaxID=2631580 RepID=UPI001FFAB3DF|nr:MULTISPECIES: thiamine pyrophosphate-dependent enzyme [unclassified Bradyrhizobium]
MGSAVPSGLCASLRSPDRRVIAFCGDGGFLITGNELAVAVARSWISRSRSPTTSPTGRSAPSGRVFPNRQETY